MEILAMSMNGEFKKYQEQRIKPLLASLADLLYAIEKNHIPELDIENEKIIPHLKQVISFLKRKLNEEIKT